MKVLVIGGAGYVGPVVVEGLRNEFPSAHIEGVDAGWFADQMDSSDPLPEARYGAFRFADVRDLIASDLRGVNAVIYLAAISNDPMGDRFAALTRDINHLQAVRVARLAKDEGVANFVFASSASVYGRGDGPRKETDETSPQTAYARSKIDAEHDLASLAGAGMRVTCLRFATACGWSPRIRLDLVLNDFVASGLVTGRIDVLSDGTPWRPLIHVRDMARAVAWALSEERMRLPGVVVVNAGSEDWNFQIRDLARAVAEQLGGVEVRINSEAAPDTRSYMLDFTTWQRVAPNHQPRVSLDDAIGELQIGLQQLNDLDAEFRRSDRMRLRRLEYLTSEGYLDQELRWVRHART